MTFRSWGRLLETFRPAVQAYLTSPSSAMAGVMVGLLQWTAPPEVRREWHELIGFYEESVAGQMKVDPEIYHCFTDHSHLGLEYPLQNKTGGRKRSTPTVKAEPYWRRYGEW